MCSHFFSRSASRLTTLGGSGVTVSGGSGRKPYFVYSLPLLSSDRAALSGTAADVMAEKYVSPCL